MAVPQTVQVTKFQGQTVEELRAELDLKFRLLIDRVDQAIGARGEPKFLNDVNFNGKRPRNIAAPVEDTDAQRVDHCLASTAPGSDYNAQGRRILDVATAEESTQAVNLSQLRDELAQIVTGTSAINPPPEVEDSGTLGTINDRFAREDHTHSGANLSDAQTVGGAKTFSDKATFSDEIEVDGDLNHDGSNVGFFGTAPAAQAAAYTPTNVTTDRTYDANSTTLDEIADVLGTLIADLQSYGLLQ